MRTKHVRQTKRSWVRSPSIANLGSSCCLIKPSRARHPAHPPCFLRKRISGAAHNDIIAVTPSAANPIMQSCTSGTTSDASWWWSGGDEVNHSHRNGQRASYYGTGPSRVWKPPPGNSASAEHGHTSSTTVAAANGTSDMRTQPVSHPEGYHRATNDREPAAIRSQMPSVGSRTVASVKSQATGYSRRFTFVSPMKLDDPPAPDGPMPPMSEDGGSQEEFEEYWEFNNRRPRQVGDGWMEYRAHPQVKIEPYWFHLSSGALTFDRPATATGPVLFLEQDDGLQDLTGTGPVWELSVKDLKAALKEGMADDLALDAESLAQRAVAEYERFLPRVLSWHDYQYITFWFFGGMEKENRQSGGDREKSAKSFFAGDGSATRSMFASDAFFKAAAKLLMERMHRMHPINLTYFVWTFSRAGVIMPDLMQAVGDHMLNTGQLPQCDRCSVGTMVWNFYKCGIRHDRYFEATAAECVRPNRLRSLAPRNFQNTMIAFSRRGHWHEKYVDAMARGIMRLLDAHDPRYPKTDTKVLFSYTCVNGSEVPADCFRIGSLTVILRAFQDFRVGSPDQPQRLIQNCERCCASMVDYVHRSVERSPQFMREPGDAAEFFLQLSKVVVGGSLHTVASLLPTTSELQALVQETPAGRTADQLKELLARERQKDRSAHTQR